MLNVIINILIVISGICWSVVYVDSIRLGFKQKTYAIPLFALALNIAWEGIYAYTDLFIRCDVGAQAIANTAWFLLDIFIVVTYFKFGREEAEGEMGKRLFVPWTLLVLAIGFTLQILFLVEFGDVAGEKYSAFLQNLAMSVAYLYMLNRRRSAKGQSMLIAVCKCIGTLTPTIFGTIEGNLFILVTGTICFLLDLVYIYCLHHVTKKERLQAAR